MTRLWIYHSELRAMAQETSLWTGETGGDLFGFWEPEPVVLLATRLGPQSEREAVRCRFDLAYVERLSRALWNEWGLHYLGDWHSHGVSDYTNPSRTDRERVGRVLARNRFPQLMEGIATRSSERPDRVALHGYSFQADTWFDPSACEIGLLPGVSPIREVLALRRDDPWGQDRNASVSFPLTLIDGLTEMATVDDRIAAQLQTAVVRRAIEQLIGRLERAFPGAAVSGPLDLGNELSILTEHGEVDLRFSAAWPFALQAVRRGDGAFDFGGLNSPISALRPAAVIDVCQQALGLPGQLAADSDSAPDCSL